MAQLRRDLPVGAWKVYTHAGGPGWFLDDHDRSAPQVGQRFIDQARKLGPPIVAVHKGFSGVGRYPTYADPGRRRPGRGGQPGHELRRVPLGLRHQRPGSAPSRALRRVARTWASNRLITSVRKAGIEPGGNVYAELGSTWRAVMARPDEAAHVLGKLLAAFGEDNVVWGTDSIWYGSPQDQIQAFRAFEISARVPGALRLPALTPAVKAKIFGLNSARLYKIDPIRNACRIPRDQVEQARLASFDTNAMFGPRNAQELFSFARAELAQFASQT